MNQTLLKEYAKLAVRSGVNVQQGQNVVIRASVETKDLVRLLTEEAYLAGAKKVYVQWSDEYVSRLGYLYMDDETLADIAPSYLQMQHEFVDSGACFISITSPIPGLNKDVDPKKMQKASIVAQKALAFVSHHTMGNKTQWTVIAMPNPVWAKQVFPDLSEADAVETLMAAILDASRVWEGKDTTQEWLRHNETLLAHNQILNDYAFDHLRFKNNIGTDLVVKLVKNHVWAGGGEHTTGGVYFNPNIPTEETFTMPHKFGTQGKVVATKPLNYQGKLIEDFWLQFDQGKVVAFGAKKEEAALQSLLEFDEGSSYIGEIALISHDSPISNSNILFLNTLFDENASCHMALGRAYPMNVQGGNDMSPEELEKVGYNQSMTHNDFMFGSSDMSIIGVLEDGKEVTVFENGNFVI
ncbi:MAG: aminopeptidase [Candidatus Izemoplasmatales bacterium]